MENYFNDAPIDVATKSNTSNVVTPVVGEALGDFGLVLFFDHTWNSQVLELDRLPRAWTSATANGQAPPIAYKSGQCYFSANLLYTPVKNVLMGGELLWANRANYTDGFSSDDVRLQFTFKYNFSVKVGGQ